MKNKKRKTIFLLVLLILGISVGFAVLTTVLYINGNGLVKGNTWSVHWDNAEVLDGSISTVVPDIGEDQGDPENTKATWSCEFTEPGQYYAFTIDAVNDGTVNAIIDEIQVTATPELPHYINYRVTYAEGGTPKKNDLLAKNSSRKYKVVVEYSSDITPEELNNLPETTTYNFELNTPYNQEMPKEEDKYLAKADLKIENEKLKDKTDDQLTELYGEDVTGFNTIYPIEWQLFYSDEDNVYLITKDYVRTKYLPKEVYEISEDTVSNPNYRADFGYLEVINGYQYAKGDIIHSEPWNAGTDSVAFTSNPITNKYFKFAAAYPKNTSNNVVASAYMMDTSIWANFAGDVEGAFAMGGVPLEMWILSYNAKHTDDFNTFDAIVDGTNARTTGYAISKVDGSNAFIIDGTNSMWNISDDKTKAEYYWLIGPYSTGDNQRTSPGVYAVGSTNTDEGYLTGIYNNIQTASPNASHVGFRPLVAIPKSSLK